MIEIISPALETLGDRWDFTEHTKSHPSNVVEHRDFDCMITKVTFLSTYHVKIDDDGTLWCPILEV